MGAFALVALVLAALGLYGVLAYTVRQRTKEIGIRMAVGASAAQVRALVFRQAAAVVGPGLVAGLLGTLVSRPWLATLAFEDQPVGSAHSWRNRAATHGGCQRRRLGAGPARSECAAQGRPRGGRVSGGDVTPRGLAARPAHRPGPHAPWNWRGVRPVHRRNARWNAAGSE